ncbi:hypothetical protein ARMGADRAFT_1063850 [Armillaria gallica]|uniref:Uncharacterized protein n=1 Tax=Armillaria gallica TaxID=47427 RepID=A0A2H3DLZ3_ARMGA|nr:hypothetical protein ARMGADRAFT_1063850 [Armillaria gallica]
MTLAPFKSPFAPLSTSMPAPGLWICTVLDPRVLLRMRGNTMKLARRAGEVCNGLTPQSNEGKKARTTHGWRQYLVRIIARSSRQLELRTKGENTHGCVEWLKPFDIEQRPPITWHPSLYEIINNFRSSRRHVPMLYRADNGILNTYHPSKESVERTAGFSEITHIYAIVQSCVLYPEPGPPLIQVYMSRRESEAQ